MTRRRPSLARTAHRRIRPAPVGVALVFAAFGSLGATAQDGAPTVVGDPVRGEAVFGHYCATCHGDAGDGRGPTASRYPRFQPRDFTVGNFKFRSTLSGNLPLASDLERTVRVGLPGTPMPSFEGVLGDQAIADAVAYVRTFSDLFDDFDIYPPEVAQLPTEAPPVTDEAIHRGRQVYLLQHCWTCHGVDGAASGPQASELTDEMGNPIVPWDLTSGLFRGGDTPLDLYRTLATGLDGTPMPAYLHPNVLTRPTDEAWEQLVSELYGYSRGDVRDEDIAALRAFVDTLPTAEEAAAMAGDERQEAIERWHWDLVLYTDDLSRSGSLGRRAAGFDPPRPLFGLDREPRRARD